MDDYRILSVDYDALQPKEEIFKQEPFFKKLISKYSVKTCLDCACGTGWHLFMLHKLGVKCVGSDLSAGMLTKAKENLKYTSIKLKEENFRTLSRSWKEKFDMIICMTTSFPHNANDKEALQTLNSMYGLLNENGIIVIDNGFADAFLKAKPKIIPARIHRDQAFYLIFEYPYSQKVVFNVLNVKKTRTGFTHAFDSMEYMAIGKRQFENMIRKTRFRTVEYFGDYDFTKYSAVKSKRLIAVAQK